MTLPTTADLEHLQADALHIKFLANGAAGTQLSPDGYLHKSWAKIEADAQLNLTSAVADATASATASAATATTQAGIATTQATTATAQAAIATAAANTAVTQGVYVNKYDGLPGLVITDTAGNVYGYMTDTLLNHYDINLIRAGGIGGLNVFNSVGFGSLSLLDTNNGVWLYADEDNLRHKVIDTMRVFSVRNVLKSLFTGATFLAIYGQSLGVGYLSTPANTTSLNFAYKFNGGVRPGDAQGTNAYTTSTAMSSVVPFAEADGVLDGGNFGQTGCLSIAQMIYQVLLAEYGLDLYTERFRLLMAALGRGSRTAAQLATSPLITTVTDAIGYGKTAMELTTGLPYGGLPAMFILQGEDDYASSTTGASYTASWQSIQSQAAAQNLTTLGRQLIPEMFFYQIACHPAYSRTNPIIALQQLANEKLPRFGRIVPTYDLIYQADKVHLTQASEIKLLAKMTLQFIRRCIEGLDGCGIRAGQATNSGNTVTIPITWINGSKGTKILQDTSIGAHTNFGFRLFDSGAAAVSASAAITGGGTAVQLTWTGNTPVTVDYAFTGDTGKGYGQIRDDDRSVFKEPNGTIHRLYNLLPIYSGTVI